MISITEKHSSKSFDNDLNELVDTFIRMGRLVADQVTAATHALMDSDNEIAIDVIIGDDVVNKMEVDIDDQIVLILAKRQPTANDLRLVMALSKGVVDLERVGDEASKIASMARQLIEDGSLLKGYCEVQHLSNQARLMLLEALDSFAHMDANKAFNVLKSNADLVQEYDSASCSLMTYIMEDNRHVSKTINLLWVLRSLERISDHARNIAELIIYYTSGRNVRHADFVAIEQAVHEASGSIASHDQGNENQFSINSKE